MADTAAEPRHYCALPPQPVRVFPPDMPADRANAILLGSAKWVNGTVLHYHFLEGPEAQKKVVRDSFGKWKGLPIGLAFQEVDDAADAEVRIAFQDDGSWSYIGRQVLNRPATEATMNFGWDLTTPYGHTTALHEIGHTLGLPHEHQNPFAGIVWNEQAVYDFFAGAPNFWPRDQTFSNVLRKLSRAEVAGSQWDPDSIMEYDFPAGLIVKPAEYSNGVSPPGTLSALDQQWAKTWYPGADEAPAEQMLVPFQSVPLTLASQQQVDLVFECDASRKYTLGTFGSADTVIVLFEDDGGDPRYLAGDDDSGTDRNARLTLQLLKGRRYVLRVRLYWAGDSGQTAVMLW
jgi:hypothetical protein